MFEKFWEYMCYLMPAVLKQNKHINQFRIFFMVVGRLFDDLKQATFRLRREASLDTCSDCMLEIAGQDRDMMQLKGESYEAYRKRLKMKVQVAAMSGTLKGLLYAIESVGYDNCMIEPVWKTDPNRWAEININFLTASVDEDITIDFRCIVSEVMKVKRASTLPHYIFHYPTAVESTETPETVRVINRFREMFFSGALYFDGTWLLDGSVLLDAEIRNINVRFRNRYLIETAEDIETKMVIMKDLWYLNGEVMLDGSRILDAERMEVEL